MNELTETIKPATFMTKLYQSDLCDVRLQNEERLVGDKIFTPSLSDKDWYVDNGNAHLIMTHNDLRDATISKVNSVEYKIETDEQLLRVWLYKVMGN